ncbi:UDP-N-acetylmuramoyl-tripeptide--D-alanyl-D-alanine ligase [bacterium LRH843]|nr:UDP-N-acetylmuramoyl-tripeptide--D-alanyl-D-alanine ligase [bacterium LRH843]
MLNASLLNGIIESIRLPEKSFKYFSSVSTDSRKMAKNALFVPLIGDRFNGHQFIQDAIASGAAASLWEENQPIPESMPNDFQLYFVKNTLLALQQMAKAYRDEVNPVVIGVTGSNGKTTTKDLLSAVLTLHGETYKTLGNFNNHIGLPLTILSMPNTTKYIVLEMGMSGFGEIALLSRIGAPDVAVVTNIGESHMEQLGSREGIAKAKMEIREGLKGGGFVIIDGDEQLLSPYVNERTYSVGFSHSCDALLSSITPLEDGYSFSYGSTSFRIPLLGKHNVKNAGYSIAIARILGVSDETIQRGLLSVSLTGMRLERQKGTNGETIINDAYNASPSSMIAAIETIKALQSYKKYIVVLGDMYELGPEEERLHRSVAKALEAPLTHLLFVGKKAKWIADEWKKTNMKQMAFFATESKEEAAAYLHSIVDRDSVILFKASRGMKLEEIIAAYQSQRKEE